MAKASRQDESGSSQDDLWESAFQEYLEYTIQIVGNKDSLAEIIKIRRQLIEFLREVERSTPEQYSQLESSLEARMIELENGVNEQMAVYRLYLEREKRLAEADKIDLALQQLRARNSSRQMTEL